MSTSRRLSRGVAGEPSNGWSGSAVISGDGGVVAFESSATNLVAGVDANGILPDVYLVDTRTDVTRRISVDDHDVQSGAGSSGGPSVSADGRYVVFTSTADLDLARPAGRSRTAAAGGAFPQVYVHDARLTRTKHLGSSRQAPNGGSVNAVISGDGRYVAFVSYATNLAPSDRNRSVDVFLYEMNTGSITLVSRSTSGRTANGASGNPSISADGRFVAFQSEASDMVCARACESAAEDINLLPDVFLFDRMTHTVRGISGGSDGPWMEESGAPALDAIGDVIAFTSRHPIDARDLRNDFDLFVRVSTEGDSHIHRDHPRHPLTTPIH
jgi:Tol biopolymer transport system component